MDQNVLKDSIPPHSIEAEQAVLGSLLLDWNNAIANVVSYLRPDRFYSIQHQLIFDAMLKLFNQNKICDTLSLSNQLSIDDNLEKAGGNAYLASLTDTVPSSANIEYYAKIVMDRATRRDLIRASSEIKSSAFDLQKESTTLLDGAEQKIFSIAERFDNSQIYDAKLIMMKEIELVQARCDSKNQFTGVPSGFAKLDKYTSGFQKSELIIIGARPSIGKTALALSMIQNIACEKHIPCGFFSLEMAYESIGMRLLAQESRISMQKIKSGMMRYEDILKVQDAAGRWYEAPLYVVDTPNMRLMDLKAMARRMVMNQKVEIIFIDYIGLITTEDPSAPVFEQVSEISKSLKALARELDIPIVALCQVARDAEGQKPNLAQLRGSGSIEQDADVVMFLHRERLKEELKGQNASQEAELILAKQRNGATGDIKILFIPTYSKFESKVDDDE